MHRQTTLLSSLALSSLLTTKFVSIVIISFIVLTRTLQRQCGYMFPGTDTVPKVDQTNAAYKGWNGHSNNLFFANGHRQFILSYFICRHD